MAKDYAEMLRKAREGYAAATSGDTSGASKSGAKDYAKMLQDARNRVQGIQSNNDADAAQRASNERTVAARYYTNNLQYPGAVKKTPEQQSHDRVVYARQPISIHIPRVGDDKYGKIWYPHRKEKPHEPYTVHP